MGFWSGLGKAALKIAPIAASFIPGVGPLAAMAIGAGTSAASKKLEGGSWKDAALAGGLGAATSGTLGKIKGLGPSGKIIDGVLGGGRIPGQTPPYAPEYGKDGKYGGLINAGIDAIGTLASGRNRSNQSNQKQNNQQTSRGLGPSNVYQGNFAGNLSMGQRDAIRNQPFRSGYTTYTDSGEVDDAGNPITFENKVPPIYSSRMVASSRGRRR